MSFTESDKLISIIVPMYNCEDYVVGFFNNICNQDYKNIQIICVAEKSKDRTIELVDEYASKDERIVVVKQKHLNAGAARNKGIEHIKGDYVIFLDADDTFTDSFISTMYKTIEENQSDLVICHTIIEKKVYYTMSNGGYLDRCIPFKINIHPSQIRDVFASISTFVHNRMYRSEIIVGNNLHFSSTRCLNDVLFACSSLLSCEKITFIEENLYTYRCLHNSNSITSSRSKYKQDVLTVFNQLYTWLVEQNLFERYKNSYYRIWKNALHGFLIYDYDEEFNYMVCDHLTKVKPFSDMSYKELYKVNYFNNSLKRIKYHFIKMSKGNDIRNLQRENQLKNISRIRETLINEYGFDSDIKDSLIQATYYKIKDLLNM